MFESIDNAIAFNNDQRAHEQIFQRLCLTFAHNLMQLAVDHDTSKWSKEEYSTFVGSRDSLRGSTDGNDAEYERHYRSEAIQNHVKNNPHHPEYWDAIGEAMPLLDVISMFFDWQSRSIQKGGDMADFWEYNLAKLKNQPHAAAIVEAMRRDHTVLMIGPPRPVHKGNEETGSNP